MSGLVSYQLPPASVPAVPAYGGRVVSAQLHTVAIVVHDVTLLT